MAQILTQSKKELEDILRKEIDDFNDGVLCIQSGHFSLINDEKNNIAVPAIFEDIENKEKKKL